MTDDVCGPDDAPDHDLEQAYAEWEARADELDAAASASIDTGDPAVIGQAFTDLAGHLAGVVELEDLIEHLLVARDAWIDAGDFQNATECLSAAGMFAFQAGDCETAAEAYEICVDEFRSIGHDELAAEAANNLGAACTRVGEFSKAEKWLNDSLSYYRRHGLADAIPDVRVNLGVLYGHTGRTADATREFFAARDYFESVNNIENAATTSMALAAMYIGTAGQLHLAKREIERGIADYTRLQRTEEVRDCEIMLAYCLSMTGEVARANHLYDQAKRYYAEINRPDKAATVDYNLANMYTQMQQFERADIAFDAAEEGLAAAGQHHNLSRLEWNRVKRYFTEAAVNSAESAALTRMAIDAALTSLVAADYERFQFVDPRRRADWTSTLTTRTAMTFSIVAQFGDDALMADVIEWGINGGVYGLSGVGDDAASDLPEAEEFDERFSDARTFDGDNEPSLTMGAVNLLARPDLPMTPPPTLLGIDGQVVLGHHRTRAASLDPDVDRVLAAVPSVAAW